MLFRSKYGVWHFAQGCLHTETANIKAQTAWTTLRHVLVLPILISCQNWWSIFRNGASVPVQSFWLWIAVAYYNFSSWFYPIVSQFFLFKEMAYLSLLSLTWAVSLGWEGTGRDTSTQPMCEVFESNDGWVPTPRRSSKQEVGWPGETDIVETRYAPPLFKWCEWPLFFSKMIFLKNILHLNLYFKLIYFSQW